MEEDHRRQKQGCCCRKLGTAGVGNAAGPGLGGGGVLAVQSKGGGSGVPAAACYGAREEGTGGAGTLGESLWCPYVPLSRD